MTSQDRRPFRIVLLGRRCTQTMATLHRLLSQDLVVAAILIPSSRDFGPAVRQVKPIDQIQLATTLDQACHSTVDLVATSHEIPLFEIRRPMAQECVQLLMDLVPDLLVVSCFPWRVPNPVIQTARHGGINLHPSLLPRYRGPDPLFWALQTDATAWGVSVHLLTDRFDAGAIVRQRSFDLRGVQGESDLEAAVSEIGAEALIDAIDDIRSGTASPVAQDESIADYRGYPDETDLEIQPTWTVGHAINFVNGVVQLGYQPLVDTDRGKFHVRSAVPVSSRDLGQKLLWLGLNQFVLRVSDGVIKLMVEAVTR